MIISVLVCAPDGGQAIEEREVPDTWFSAVTETGEAAQETAAESETAQSVT